MTVPEAATPAQAALTVVVPTLTPHSAAAQPRLRRRVAIQGHGDRSLSSRRERQRRCEPGDTGTFEWCMNAPAVDKNGTIYAISEDGWLYAIDQGGTMRDRIFLELAVGAAYTPAAIGHDGRIYAQNYGHLFVAGR